MADVGRRADRFDEPRRLGPEEADRGDESIEGPRAKELVILAAVVGVASVVLVDAHAWLVRLPPTNRSGARS